MISELQGRLSNPAAAAAAAAADGRPEVSRVVKSSEEKDGQLHSVQVELDKSKAAYQRFGDALSSAKSSERRFFGYELLP